MIDHAQGTRRVYQLNPAAFASLREYFDEFWGSRSRRSRTGSNTNPNTNPNTRTAPHDSRERSAGSQIRHGARDSRARVRHFTDDMDSWWPRSHHVGKTPLKANLIESRPGGRCYSQHEDGTECDWGTVLVWEPPQRIVLAWQVSATWQSEPDLAKASEVEVTFTALDGGLDASRPRAPPPRARWPDGRSVPRRARFTNRMGGLLAAFAARASERADETFSPSPVSP